MLRCLRCVLPNFVLDSQMLRLCGYLSVGAVKQWEMVKDSILQFLQLDSIKETTGCIRKKYTVGKSSLKSDAREICENFQ